MATVRFPAHIYRTGGRETRERVTAVSADRPGQHLVSYAGPLERMPDALGDVVPGPPAQQALRPADAGEGARDVTRPPGGLTRFDGMVGDPVERGEELTDGGAGAGAQVDDGHRPGQGVEPGKRGHVRRGQVPDMDVV